MWWPETGSESLWSFRICNLHILNSDEGAESDRIPDRAFNLLAILVLECLIVPVCRASARMQGRSCLSLLVDYSGGPAAVVAAGRSSADVAGFPA
jgi:hypothetical protein